MWPASCKASKEVVGGGGSRPEEILLENGKQRKGCLNILLRREGDAYSQVPPPLHSWARAYKICQLGFQIGEGHTWKLWDSSMLLGSRSMPLLLWTHLHGALPAQMHLAFISPLTPAALVPRTSPVKTCPPWILCWCYFAFFFICPTCQGSLLPSTSFLKVLCLWVTQRKLWVVSRHSSPAGHNVSVGHEVSVIGDNCLLKSKTW